MSRMNGSKKRKSIAGMIISILIAIGLVATIANVMNYSALNSMGMPIRLIR